MSSLPPCTIQHESTELTGWELVDVWYKETVCVKHVVPHNDLRVHTLDPGCWCVPVEDHETPDLWAHNSADERERYEDGTSVH